VLSNYTGWVFGAFSKGVSQNDLCCLVLEHHQLQVGRKPSYPPFTTSTLAVQLLLSVWCTGLYQPWACSEAGKFPRWVSSPPILHEKYLALCTILWRNVPKLLGPCLFLNNLFNACGIHSHQAYLVFCICRSQNQLTMWLPISQSRHLVTTDS
jgi:hypothetical protein